MRDRTIECFSRWNRHEPLLHELMTLLFAQSLLGGAVLDAGAHTGTDACYFAKLDEERKVYAVEPLMRNINVLKRQYHYIPNIHVVRAALGSRTRKVSEDQVHNAHHMLFQIHHVGDAEAYTKRQFYVKRVDDMFLHTPLAFARIDVEGAELDILRGANVTLRRDSPVLAIELDPVARLRHANKILGMFTETYGYHAFFVPERAGDKNQRNVLFLPVGRRVPKLVHQKTIRVARRNFDRDNVRRLLRLTAYYQNRSRLL